jgi:hypothetical protein
MKRIIVAVSIALAILGAGVAYWLISPLFITKTVNESLPVVVIPVQTESVTTTSVSTSTQVATTTAPILQTVYQGTFTGFDAVHHGTGTASVIKVGDKSYVRFEEDFVVGNGPDLFVGFGKDGTYIKGSEVGALKGDKGSQNYELAEGFDSEKYNEVWVWCRAFSVPFAKASLEKTANE